MYVCRLQTLMQMLMQTRGSVHLAHLACVMRMLPALRLHLTCVPVTRPAVTGVNVIKDTPVMDWTAQVNRVFLQTAKNTRSSYNSVVTLARTYDLFYRVLWQSQNHWLIFTIWLGHTSGTHLLHNIMNQIYVFMHIHLTHSLLFIFPLLHFLHISLIHCF